MYVLFESHILNVGAELQTFGLQVLPNGLLEVEEAADNLDPEHSKWLSQNRPWP